MIANAGKIEMLKHSKINFHVSKDHPPWLLFDGRQNGTCSLETVYRLLFLRFALAGDALNI